ncbi:MAG: glycosyltransferase, partial [Jatrophihabitantaceae bacterium]
IEKQTYPLEHVEIIAVDDGSSDDSLALLQEWAKRRPGLVRVLTQENGGQASARNLGLEHVRGEWVTFPDPDDVLEPDYFSIVDGFLRDNPSAVMAATARIMWQESTGQVIDNHPLRPMFDGRDRLVDLNRAPEFFHSSAPAAFLRTDVVAREGLRFDPLIRPHFEDGHFCARYLLAAGAPNVGFLGTAHYIYRRRADGSSTLQGGLGRPERFVVVPRRGYLDLLTRGVAPGAYAAPWVQNLVLYELSYYFSSDQQLPGATAARGEVADEFVELLREIAARLDPAVVAEFDVRRLDPAWRDILLHAFGDTRWVSPYAVRDRSDPRRQLVRLSYRFTGVAPQERILVRGERVQVRDGKIWTHTYFGHPLMSERVAWVRADDAVQVILDGEPVPLRPAWSGPTWSGPSPSVPRPVPLRRATRVVRRLARTWVVRRRFGDAWTLLDQVHAAGDNAEQLFRHLREHRPDVNAWFVLERGTPDWDRLRRDGYGRRLIPHGGVLWRLLMLNCTRLISSHADASVHRPPAILRMKPEPQWAFTFLQHGVLDDDRSSWLNPKRFDLFVTSTPQERASIVDDYTPYAYTGGQVPMAGLPRFDRLRELGAAVPPGQRRYLLVCPTWPWWLAPPSAPGSPRPGEFSDSDYVRQWTAFLGDERLARLAADHGLRIGLLPHPDVAPALAQLELPAHVEMLSFAGRDVQQRLAEAALLVTDYSALAFDAAYLDRPVVYLQFDAEPTAAGAHVGRRGYFDYRDDGFGPVTDTVDRAVEDVATILSSAGGQPAAQYQQRIAATFIERDGRCCERTIAAIELL